MSNSFASVDRKIEQMHTETREDLRALRTESRDYLRALRAESREDRRSLRTEMSDSFTSLDSKLDQLRSESREDTKGLRELTLRLRDSIAKIGERLAFTEGFIQGKNQVLSNPSSS